MTIDYDKIKEDLKHPDRWYVSDDKFERINEHGDVVYYFVISTIDDFFGFTKLELIREHNTIELSLLERYRLTKLIIKIRNIVITNQQVQVDTSRWDPIIREPRLYNNQDFTFISGSTQAFYPAVGDYHVSIDSATDETAITKVENKQKHIKINNQDFKDKINLEKERIRKILAKDKISDNR